MFAASNHERHQERLYLHDRRYHAFFHPGRHIEAPGRRLSSVSGGDDPLLDIRPVRHRPRRPFARRSHGDGAHQAPVAADPPRPASGGADRHRHPVLCDGGAGPFPGNFLVRPVDRCAAIGADPRRKSRLEALDGDFRRFSRRIADPQAGKRIFRRPVSGSVVLRPAVFALRHRHPPGQSAGPVDDQFLLHRRRWRNRHELHRAVLLDAADAP